MTYPFIYTKLDLYPSSAHEHNTVSLEIPSRWQNITISPILFQRWFSKLLQFVFFRISADVTIQKTIGGIEWKYRNVESFRGNFSLSMFVSDGRYKYEIKEFMTNQFLLHPTWTALLLKQAKSAGRWTSLPIYFYIFFTDVVIQY